MESSTTPQAIDGLWKQNQALVAMLGLCPLLAVSNTLIHALGLGMATIVVLVSSSTLISLCRQWIPTDLRLPIFVLIIAGNACAMEMLMHAFLPELHKTLGIFIPLIVTNCIILGRAESHASKNPPRLAALDGLYMGIGFALVLLILGALREALGQGTLFAGAEHLFGDGAQNWKLNLLGDDGGMQLFIYPPGAFIALGLLLAIKNAFAKP